MERENDWDSDFCDLEPGKICDNCCRCLDMDRDYNEIEASLLRTDEIVSIGDWDAEADAYYFEAWEDAEEPEHEEIPPIQNGRRDCGLMKRSRGLLICAPCTGSASVAKACSMTTQGMTNRLSWKGL